MRLTSSCGRVRVRPTGDLRRAALERVVVGAAGAKRGGVDLHGEVARGRRLGGALDDDALEPLVVGHPPGDAQRPGSVGPRRDTGPEDDPIAQRIAAGDTVPEHAARVCCLAPGLSQRGPHRDRSQRAADELSSRTGHVRPIVAEIGDSALAGRAGPALRWRGCSTWPGTISAPLATAVLLSLCLGWRLVHVRARARPSRRRWRKRIRRPRCVGACVPQRGARGRRPAGALRALSLDAGVRPPRPERLAHVCRRQPGSGDPHRRRQPPPSRHRRSAAASRAAGAASARRLRIAPLA